MKRILLALALVIALAAAAVWLAAGANRGWTKTSVPVKTLDPVTGIEGITYQNRFLPGVDFLGAAFLGAALIGGASVFFRKHKTDKNNNLQPQSTTNTKL